MDKRGMEYYRINFRGMNFSGRIILEVKDGEIVRDYGTSRDYEVRLKKITEHEKDLERKIN